MSYHVLLVTQEEEGMGSRTSRPSARSVDRFVGSPFLLTIFNALIVEKEINTHDAVFPVPDQGKMRTDFRLLLLCTADLWHEETLERMERLSVLNGASHVAIVLLLVGNAAMTAFARFQMKFVSCFLSLNSWILS